MIRRQYKLLYLNRIFISPEVIERLVCFVVNDHWHSWPISHVTCKRSIVPSFDLVSVSNNGGIPSGLYYAAARKESRIWCCAITGCYWYDSNMIICQSHSWQCWSAGRKCSFGWVSRQLLNAFQLAHASQDSKQRFFVKQSYYSRPWQSLYFCLEIWEILPKIYSQFRGLLSISLSLIRFSNSKSIRHYFNIDADIQRLPCTGQHLSKSKMYYY